MYYWQYSDIHIRFTKALCLCRVSRVETNLEPSDYRIFVGKYSKGSKHTHEFLIHNNQTFWKSHNQKPELFIPASETVLVDENDIRTLEFFFDDDGEVTKAIVRWKDGRTELRKIKQDKPRIIRRTVKKNHS